MSKYDKERETLGLKPIGGVTATEKKKSKYAKDREVLYSPTISKPDVTNDSRLLNQENLERKKFAAKQMVENAKTSTAKPVKTQNDNLYEPIEPSYIEKDKNLVQKIRYNIMKNEAKKTAETASKIVTPDEWNLYKGLFTKGVKMNADEVSKAREVESKIEYAKKNGLEKFYDRFGASYRKGLGLGDDVADAEKTEQPITTGSKVADVGADILGMAASFSRTGGTGLVKPSRLIAETMTNKLIGKGTTTLGKIGEKLTVGELESIPYSVQQVLTDEELQKDPAKMAIAVVENMTLGGLTEVGIAGLGKLIKKIFPAIKKVVPNMTETDLTNAVANKYKLGKTTGSYKLKTPTKEVSKTVRELPSAERLLLPEKATSSLEAPSVPLTQYEKKVLKTPVATKKVEVPVETTINKVSTKMKGSEAKKATKTNEVFYTDSKTEVIKNPSDKQYSDMIAEFKKEFPEASKNGEPAIRKTYDKEGNLYIWKSSDNIHGNVEPYINKKFNTITNQGKNFTLNYNNEFVPSTEIQKGTVVKYIPDEKASEKLKTLEEKQRQQVASMTGSKVLPEQPKKLQVPEQYKREMPRRTTTAEIESTTKGTPHITKLKTPTKTAETPKPIENIQTTAPKTTAENGVQKLKTSQFRTNTLERAKNIPESVKEELKLENFDYIPETKKEWQDKAVQNVTANRQKVINEIKSAETISGGVQAHEGAIITEQMVNDVLKGKPVNNELLNFTEDLAAKTREWARGLKGTDTAWDKLSPAGTLIKAQREIMNSVPEELKAAVKTEVKETKTVLEAINKVNKDNINQVFKDLTGEKPKVSKGVREWLEKQETEAVTRVKEYFKHTDGIIKMHSGIPGEVLTDLAKVGAAKLARKTMDFAEWSVEMIKDFGEKVKPYLQQIFDDSNKLIKSKSLKTPEQKAVTSIDNVVKKALKDNGIKIQDIARKHVSEIDETGQTLAQKLTEQANLSPEVAAKVEKLFTERLKALTTAKKQQILDQMFKPKRTYQRKSLGDKIIEFSNMGAIGDSKYTNILNEKYNIPELDAETAKKIIKQSEHIQTVDNVFERQKLVNKMMNDIRNKIPSSFAAKAKSFTMINTLLNPKTIGSRNILGNVTQMAAMRANKAIMSAIDFTTSKLTGKDRTITFKTNRGIGNVIKDFFSDVKTGAKAGWEGYTPYGSISEFKMASQSFQGKYNLLTYMEKALGAALSGAGDYPFYMKAVMDSIGEQSVLKAMNQGLKGQALKDAAKKYSNEIINSAKNISDFSSNVLKKANEAGEKATFRDANVISNILQGVHDTFNIAGFGKTKATIGKIPSREFGLGDIVVMFAKTPGALLNIGLEYSPAGVAKSLYYIGEGIVKHAKGTGGVNREKVIESFTKAIGGTLLLSGTGYYLTSKGAVTGKSPKDKEARNFFDENGMKSYSFNVDAITRWYKNGFDESQLKPQKGDKWYTYDWLAPFSFNVGLGANVAQEGIGFKTLKTIPDIMGASVQMFAENDAVSKLINVQVNKDITERLIDTAVAIPSRFVPIGSILNQIRQMTDNTKRDVASDDWKVKTMNLLKNRLPGLSKTLPEVINQDGTVKEMYAGGSNNPLNVFLSPGYLGIYETSPGRQLLIDLYKSTGKTSQFPKTATNKIKVYQQDVTLTSEEKAKLQKYIGRLTWQTLDNLPDEKEFADLSDEKKLRVISNLLEEIGNMGEEYIGELKGIKPETKAEKKKRLKENEVPKLKVVK